MNLQPPNANSQIATEEGLPTSQWVRFFSGLIRWITPEGGVILFVGAIAPQGWEIVHPAGLVAPAGYIWIKKVGAAT